MTGSTCSWSAASAVDWIVITTTTSGTGPGTIGLEIKPNTSGAVRTGAITVGDQTATIQQEGQAPCDYTVSPASETFPAAGGSATIQVRAPSHCSWSAVPSHGWVTVTAGGGGAGDGTISYSVGPNATNTERTATITVADKTVTIRQSAAAPVCSFAISPSSASFDSSGGSGTIAVTTAAECRWGAATSASWIRITAPTSEVRGSGRVDFAIDPNSGSARTGEIIVAGQSFTVTQQALGLCEYRVSPVDFSPCMTWPNDLTTTIATQPACPWTANPSAPWITITAGQSGSGTGVIRFRVADNWEAPRVGLVMVRWPTPTQGQNVRVAQAGCYYAVSQNALGFGAAGGSGSFDVFQQADPNTCGGPLQNACMWTARSDVSWVTITTSMPRFGDDRVSFTVAANDGAARTAVITVRDRVVTITQTGR